MPEKKEMTFKEARKRLYDLGIIGRDGKPKWVTNVKEGQKAYMDVDTIIGRDDFERMDEEYREFVESSRGVPLTIHLEKGKLVSVVENPKWFFWAEDFTAIDDGGGEEDGGNGSG